jgi:putative lipoic acid-binding regulatory protein
MNDPHDPNDPNEPKDPNGARAGDGPQGLQFPTDFPIKIMGRRDDGFAQAIVEVVLQHAPDFDASTLEMRASRDGNYLSLTATVRAVSREQLDALYRALTSHPMVKIVL